jgi:lipopolysaccharide transport system ATP-binding protein
VLLMDEWFLAGDAAFMDKARQRMESLVRDAEILVLSTHNEDVVLEWATRVIWLDQGRVREDGPAREVLGHYLGRDLSEAPVGEIAAT